eukprot:TRINITY_DN4136_c0_g1_i2.p1 TRINITY_DN4136_c0_g1~~TRINITY_DN4136_c0_g1_i2.p1  ORF type:complete len:171 (+),score=29.24 TRINITY_DN4136_c0_g1_i2:307-819(+)
MWWMCNNTQNHSKYLATVAQYAREQWGLAFTSLEPFNEPIGLVGRHGEEGCHFKVPTQAAGLKYLKDKMSSLRLSGVDIADSDECTYSMGLVDKINVHGYEYGGGRRDVLYQEAKGKRIWNSEYGDEVEMVGNLNLDFRWFYFFLKFEIVTHGTIERKLFLWNPLVISMS